MSLFKGQDLDITCETGIFLTGASSVKLLYQKPDGTKGEVNGTADGTKVTGTLTATILDTIGTWTCQVYAVIGGKVRIGEIFKLIIINNLK